MGEAEKATRRAPAKKVPNTTLKSELCTLEAHLATRSSHQEDALGPGPPARLGREHSKCGARLNEVLEVMQARRNLYPSLMAIRKSPGCR